MRPVGTEDIAIVHVRNRPGAVGSIVISQVSAGRKNRLWFELDGEHEKLGFDREQPRDPVGREPRAARRDPARPAGLDPAAAGYATLPGGHPQGYNDCFDAFVADTYAAIRTARSVDGLPDASPTGCARPR